MISEFPLFLFTTLAGIAAGGYVARAIVPLEAERRRPWLFAIVCLVMLAISGVALLGHLGQPARILHAFSNPSAGITQEGVATMLFGVAVVADGAFCLARKEAPRWLVVAAAVLGVVLTAVMGLAYYALIGTLAWASIATVPFFVLGDLAMGVGFYLAFNPKAIGNRALAAYDVAVQVLAALAIAAVTVHFAGLGYSAVPFVVGLIVGPAAACALAVAGQRAGKGWMPYALCACAIVGIAITRYAFYMGCLI